jgi:hypothetical protein
MVHFTCDLCGKDLTASGDPRFVVKIEAYAGFDPAEITEDDLDEDHMEAISKLLERDPHLAMTQVEEHTFKGFRFDLCPCCHRRFIKDPLARDLLRSLDFSEN